MDRLSSGVSKHQNGKQAVPRPGKKGMVKADPSNEKGWTACFVAGEFFVAHSRRIIMYTWIAEWLCFFLVVSNSPVNVRPVAQVRPNDHK